MSKSWRKQEVKQKKVRTEYQFDPSELVQNIVIDENNIDSCLSDIEFEIEEKELRKHKNK